MRTPGSEFDCDGNAMKRIVVRVARVEPWIDRFGEPKAESMNMSTILPADVSAIGRHRVGLRRVEV